MSELKETNPKDAIGSNKLPVHLWPTTATAMGSIGLLDGMLKYGRSNWRASGVRASIYFDAANRHLNAWFEGEDHDPDSGVPHLAHALACLAIIVDAQAAGKLNDDRQAKGGYRALLSELTGHVGRLKEMHADKAPRHFTIADDARDLPPVGTPVEWPEDESRIDVIGQNGNDAAAYEIFAHTCCGAPLNGPHKLSCERGRHE